ncbi:protein FAM8A1 [Falco biarmicus]|uniref:protein FAM8A1 n=1 Tax=Falco peregrinus TaxID=8954 RepID=UPI0024788BC3|nr:protein FAM8A1 [Falco peregrinus]XP_056186204.1 protein FAM8A1 [Falco biarmicus]
MEEMAEPGAEPGAGRTGAGAAAMAKGDNERSDGVSGGAAAAASSPPCSPPAAFGGEGGGAKPLSAAEYARRVHQWLWDSYCGYLSWQGCLPALLAASAAPAAAGPPRVAATPPAPSPPPGAAAAAYYSPFYLFAPPPAHTAAAGPSPRAAAAPAPAWPGAAGRLAPVPRAASGSATGTSGSGAPRDTGRPAGREFIIPSLAHRFIAEMVDFFILFFIKATIVLSVMHLSGIKDISKFAMHYIIEEIDEDTSMEDLQKMMVVALIYRLLVCFYEIICIWGAGGATPGKFLLGLRVVTCDTSVLIAPSRVLVIPSSNVSMTTSTIRALIKNFSIASFFPAFITLLFFQHNRTAYDIVAGTIVVRRHGVR